MGHKFLDKKTVTEETTFANRPLLVIKNEGEEKAIIQFGTTKAKAILEHIEEIKAFVEKNK